MHKQTWEIGDFAKEINQESQKSRLQSASSLAHWDQEETPESKS